MKRLLQGGPEIIFDKYIFQGPKYACTTSTVTVCRTKKVQTLRLFDLYDLVNILVWNFELAEHTTSGRTYHRAVRRNPPSEPR